MKSIKILAILSFLLFSYSCKKTVEKDELPKDEIEEELPKTPVKLGTPVQVSENRGQMAIEINGEPYIAVFAFDKVDDKDRNSLLIINALTGKTDQYWYPREGSANGTLFHMLRASNNCIYTTIGNEVVEFDLIKRSWTANKTIDGIAMSFTEGPDGKIYFGTYPKSTLWEFDPKTKQARSLGQLDTQQEYPHYLGVDNSGWIYAGIGTAKANLVAINIETKARIQLSDEATRQVGYAQVFRGKDGNVYGMEPKNTNLFYRLESGTAVPVVGPVERAPQNNTHFNTFSVNKFLSGGEILFCDLSEKTFEIKDKHQSIKTGSFNYKSNGPSISSLVTGDDGNIYGSTNHPMHLWKYQPSTDNFTDYMGIAAVGGGNFPNLIAWEGKIVGPTYPNGAVYSFNPKLPWTKAVGENPNPIRLGVYADIYRPRTALLLKDGETAVMTGYSGYGRTGGGMVFYNLKTNQAQVLLTKDFIIGHSTVALKQLKNGRLVGGTSTAAPGGGERLAFTSIIFEMDPVSRDIISQVEFGADIYNLEITADEKVMGLTNTGRLFIYDPTKKSVIFQSSVTGGVPLNSGQSLIKDKDGEILLILSQSISKVSKEGRITKIADLPEKATSGLGILNNVLYYACGSDLWKCPL